MRLALLERTVSDLEQRAGVKADIIRRAESVDGTPGTTLLQARLIQQAFEQAGLRFSRSGKGVLRAIKSNQMASVARATERA